MTDVLVLLLTITDSCAMWSRLRNQERWMSGVDTFTRLCLPCDRRQLSHSGTFIIYRLALMISSEITLKSERSNVRYATRYWKSVRFSTLFDYGP